LAMAALESGSVVTEVFLQTGIEELRRRLEVLLGSHMAAPVDQLRQKQEEETFISSDSTQLATDESEAAGSKEQRLFQTGSTLLQAAFDFLGELTDRPSVTQAAQKASPDSSTDHSKPNLQTTGEQLKSVLSNALSTDESGRTRLSFVLPEKPVLENLVQSALGFLNGFLQKKADDDQ
ncbi:MAG: hypothetical protein Q4G59_04275, partial [Planctomycetia bacterium]|nr:hypothetical protein [Planctomycetia bacterium]